LKVIQSIIARAADLFQVGHCERSARCIDMLTVGEDVVRSSAMVTDATYIQALRLPQTRHQSLL
jgi:hypothetical protein